MGEVIYRKRTGMTINVGGKIYRWHKGKIIYTFKTDAEKEARELRGKGYETKIVVDTSKMYIPLRKRGKNYVRTGKPVKFYDIYKRSKK